MSTTPTLDKKRARVVRQPPAIPREAVTTRPDRLRWIDGVERLLARVWRDRLLAAAVVIALRALRVC